MRKQAEVISAIVHGLKQVLPDQVEEEMALLFVRNAIEAWKGRGAAIEAPRAPSRSPKAGGKKKRASKKKAAGKIRENNPAPDKERCQAKKPDGERCKRKATQGRYCKTHATA